MSGLSLGIDIGTSGIRTAVVDGDAQVISSARTVHLPQDPERIDARKWWEAVQTCIKAQAAGLKDVGRSISEVSRIGVDGTSGSMVLTDRNLVPMTRALMYDSHGFDAEAARIATYAPDVHITKGANSALARAMRLQSETREDAMLLHQADYIIAHLRGKGDMSDHNNALKLGFDPETESWPDWFSSLGLLNGFLPQVVATGTPLSAVHPKAADALGLSADTMVHAGTTDSIAAFMAAAPVEEGAAVTSLGTTLAVKILTSKRIDDPQVGLYSHKVGNVWLAGGASNTGGGVLASLFTVEEIEALSGQIDTNAESPLDYYPLIKPGERFPVNDPQMHPQMSPRPTDDADYLHGILESIARIEAQCYAAITTRGGTPVRRLFTAGGGAANPAWTRIRERVLGVTIEEPQHADAAVGIATYVRTQSA